MSNAKTILQNFVTATTCPESAAKIKFANFPDLHGGIPILDGQNSKLPIARVQRTQTTLAGQSAIPHGTNTTPKPVAQFESQRNERSVYEDRIVPVRYSSFRGLHEGGRLFRDLHGGRFVFIRDHRCLDGPAIRNANRGDLHESPISGDANFRDVHGGWMPISEISMGGRFVLIRDHGSGLLTDPPAFLQEGSSTAHQPPINRSSIWYECD